MANRSAPGGFRVGSPRVIRPFRENRETASINLIGLDGPKANPEQRVALGLDPSHTIVDGTA